MTRPINIPHDILLAAYRVARNAYPYECCGWMTGPKDGNDVTGIRPCINQIDSGVVYSMSEDDVVEMADSFDSDTPARIIFHSHPGSGAFFSSTDIKEATSPLGGPTYPVQHLVIGLNLARIREAAQFAWSEKTNAFVEIAFYQGEL